MLAIKSVENDETLERWQFDIHTDDPNTDPNANGGLGQGKASVGTGKGAKRKEKTEKEVQGEIREIMKQITSSVTFLPILEEPCGSLDSHISLHFDVGQEYLLTFDASGTFTLLAYTNDSPDVAIPATWGDADPHLIDRGKVEQVRLRSFSTNVHSLEVISLPIVGFCADEAARLWWLIE